MPRSKHTNIINGSNNNINININHHNTTYIYAYIQYALLLITFILFHWYFDLFNLILYSERIDVAYLKLSFVLFISGFICHYHFLREYNKHISLLQTFNKPQITSTNITNILPLLIILYLGSIILFIQSFRYIKSITSFGITIITLLFISQLLFSFLNSNNSFHANTTCISTYTILMLIGIVFKLKGFIIM